MEFSAIKPEEIIYDNHMSSSEDEEENETHNIQFLYDKLSNQEREQTEETIFQLTEEYVIKEISQYSKPDFMDSLISSITEILFDSFVQGEIFVGNEYEYDILWEYIEKVAMEWFDQNNTIYPLRQYPHMNFNIYECIFGLDEDFILAHNKQLISELQERNRLLPIQKSPEWYSSRHNMITASNLWQIFGTPASQNRLVYEKCQPMEQVSSEPTFVNTELSTHWGVKYEPVSTAFYEMLIGTSVTAFGCLSHPKYAFLGASPDGIVVDSESPYLGRMLEIKNIVNREIDGIPSEAYWIQMQIQMEVCGLDACDFLETRFKEYETEDDFYVDAMGVDATGDSKESVDSKESKKGIILYFVKRGEQCPQYCYMPLDKPINKEAVDQWIEAEKERRSNQEVQQFLFKTIYWYLDEYSLITVRRNQAWFDSVIPQITAFWGVIEKERVNGYEHRAPKPRIRAHSEIDQKIHIVKLDETQSE